MQVPEFSKSLLQTIRTLQVEGRPALENGAVIRFESVPEFMVQAEFSGAQTPEEIEAALADLLSRRLIEAAPIRTLPLARLGLVLSEWSMQRADKRVVKFVPLEREGVIGFNVLLSKKGKSKLVYGRSALLSAAADVAELLKGEKGFVLGPRWEEALESVIARPQSKGLQKKTAKEAVRVAGGNQSEAARRLGVSRHTVLRALKRNR